MWDFHLQNHQHFDTFVKDFKEKRLKIKLKYEHKISHVSYVRAHPKVRLGRDTNQCVTKFFHHEKGVKIFRHF